MSVARHTAYNFIGAVVPLAVSLVTVPLYLQAIGIERYGVLAICWLLVGYFGLFDFGLGRATAQKIATLAEAPDAERNRIFWTGTLLSGALSLTAIVVFLPLAAIGLGMMEVSDVGLHREITSALPFLVAAVPFGIAQSLLVGALEGRRAFLKINLIVSAGTIATAVLPLLTAIWIDPALPFLLGAALVARILVLMLLVLACLQAVPVHRPRIASSSEIRGLLNFGGWTTVSSVVGPLLVYWDRFAIGATLGAAAVAAYVVPFNLVWQIIVLPAALASALFPKLASSDPAESRRLSGQAVAVLAFVMTPATLLMVFGAPPFLTLWLGSELGIRTAPVACILLFGLWTNSFARIPYAHLQARARPRQIALMTLAEILPYLVVLYLCMRWLGLPGAALAWSLRCLGDAVALFWLDRSKMHTFRGLAGQGLLVLVAIALSIYLPAWALERLLIAMLAIAIGIGFVWHNRPPQLARLAEAILSLLSILKPARGNHRDG